MKKAHPPLDSRFALPRANGNLLIPEHGAKEVYLLDPTLNQRRDFADFLRVLERGNPEGRLEYYAELRAEAVTAEHAKRMRQANFKEVEIGLQSINPKAQDLMDRHNNLKAFEKGVRALQGEGVKVKVGAVPHPMEEKHYIEWVEVIDAQGKAYRQFLEPGHAPEASFCVKRGSVTAREYCNIHGLWKG